MLVHKTGQKRDDDINEKRKVNQCVEKYKSWNVRELRFESLVKGYQQTVVNCQSYHKYVPDLLRWALVAEHELF